MRASTIILWTFLGYTSVNVYRFEMATVLLVTTFWCLRGVWYCLQNRYTDFFMLLTFSLWKSVRTERLLVKTFIIISRHQNPSLTSMLTIRYFMKMWNRVPILHAFKFIFFYIWINQRHSISNHFRAITKFIPWCTTVASLKSQFQTIVPHTIYAA